MSMVTAILLAGLSPAEPGECRILLVPKLDAAEVVLAETAPAPCIAAKPDQHGDIWLVYDKRRHMVRARTAIAAGQNLGRVYFPPRPAVRAGDHVSLSAHLGRVAISREVIALQDAAPGQHFFVRDRDGQVFAISTSEARIQP